MFDQQLDLDGQPHDIAPAPKSDIRVFHEENMAQCLFTADPQIRGQLSTDQLDKMAEGRARYLDDKRGRAIERVRAYRAWLAAGSPTLEIPEIPSDADYAASRASR